MADIKKLIPHILKWEGGFVNHIADKGGATNKGITLATWKSFGYDKDGDGDVDVDDLKIINQADFEKVLKQLYWNRWKADEINNQALANILVDWCYNSGAWGVKLPQRLLGLKEDGIVGHKTLAALNKQNPKEFFDKVWAERYRFYIRLTENNETQKVFLRGWLNRLNSITFND